MSDLGRIIFLNRVIDEAKYNGDIERACIYLKKLHKLELKDRVKLGSYRLKRSVA